MAQWTRTHTVYARGPVTPWKAEDSKCICSPSVETGGLLGLSCISFYPGPERGPAWEKTGREQWNMSPNSPLVSTQVCMACTWRTGVNRPHPYPPTYADTRLLFVDGNSSLYCTAETELPFLIQRLQLFIPVALGIQIKGSLILQKSISAAAREKHWLLSRLPWKWVQSLAIRSSEIPVLLQVPKLLLLRSNDSVNGPWQSFSSKMNSLILSSPKNLSDMLSWQQPSNEQTEDDASAVSSECTLGCYCREGGVLGPLEWRTWGREENGLPPAASSGLLPQWPGTKLCWGKSFGKDIDNWALDSGSVEIKTHRINCLAQTMP